MFGGHLLGLPVFWQLQPPSSVGQELEQPSPQLFLPSTSLACVQLWEPHPQKRAHSRQGGPPSPALSCHCPRALWVSYVVAQEVSKSSPPWPCSTFSSALYLLSICLPWDWFGPGNFSCSISAGFREAGFAICCYFYFDHQRSNSNW